METKTEKNSQWYAEKGVLVLIIVAFVIFGLRLVNLNEALYDDESNFAYSLTVMDNFGYNEKYYSPVPLNLIYKQLVALFGLKTWVFRFVPWLFGILSTVLVYVLARRNWNKKVAFLATLLMLVSFYPTLASLQVDVEGNLVLFSVLLMFLAFLESLREDCKRKLLWWVVAGLSLGVAVISKYNSIYVVVTLGLYSLYRHTLAGEGSRLLKTKQDFVLLCKRLFRDVFLIYLVGFLLFILYVGVGVLISPEHFLDFIWVFGFNRYHEGSFGLIGLVMFLLWSTPLLFGFFLLSVKEHLSSPGCWVKENVLLTLWVVVPILFFTFILPSAGSMDRYFMNTIPALAILGGYFIAKAEFERKHVVGFILLGSTALVSFFAINFSTLYVARLPAIYFEKLKSFTFDFLFSYTSASGPTFGVSFATIFWTFGVGFVALVGYFLWARKHRSWGEWFLLIFLSVGVAFNLFLVSEYLFHPTGVAVSDVKREMIEYASTQNLTYPIYTNDQGIQWYFEHDYWHKDARTMAFEDNEVGYHSTNTIERIKREGGTILLLEWPPLPQESPAFEVVELCELEKEFFSKGKRIGQVYVCEEDGLFG